METDYQALSQSDLFDSEWYLNQYSDVQKVGMDPAEHFLRYGWIMRRNPSAKFNTREYLRENPDVAQAGVNPVLHFIHKGKAEGRGAPVVKKQSQDVVIPKLQSNLDEYLSSAVSDVGQDNQLAQTQQLLEHYFNRCQELEYQLMDR
ncbi:hypothetical protein [Marinobacterium aestuariivivens]|uniref:Chemoreceptor zinc-binding domain-containing protein n=1 Tax=Marinobacterium aestuariivivens TaxID=1698799 RepID=A0ABW1ZTN4_9GAMM